MIFREKEVPRPEYPRPQFVRSIWFNLNGEWEFARSDFTALTWATCSNGWAFGYLNQPMSRPFTVATVRPINLSKVR